jgi:hypothetical protein
MAHRVNPAMNAMKAPSLHPGGSALAVDPHALELGKGNDAMLGRREPRDRCVRGGVGTFRMHGNA